MTDKVQKIREEVERMHNLLPVMDGDNISINYADRICNTLEMYIDSLQEEPVNKDFEMALAEMVDKAQKCVVEPLVVAAQWKDELIKLAKNEEPVSESIDFEQELYKAFGQIKDFTLGIAIAKRFYDMGRKHNEPVSEKKCMFTKDSYTDEDRKVLCEDCKEKCAYAIAGVISTNAQIKKEPMSKAEDFIRENTKALKESNGKEYFMWISPDQAREAVEIAREEMIEKICEYLEPKIWAMNMGDQKFTDECIEKLKQAMKDET